MSESVKHLTDADFKAEIAQGATLVDFWAPWCGPCRMVAPILDELSRDFAGKAKIAKINVDDQPNTASDFGIQSIPTLLLFKDGKLVNRMVGAQPKANIASFLQTAL
ncbi:MAG TPA: thioredoxin [Holophagaceae bacterium]|nr:thioredoxin [Holophagaceae bacterium]